MVDVIALLQLFWGKVCGLCVEQSGARACVETKSRNVIKSGAKRMKYFKMCPELKCSPGHASEVVRVSFSQGENSK